LTGDRCAEWKRAATDMARRSLAPILARLDPQRVGSWVMASCTGYSGPSPDLELAGEFGLPRNLRRTFIGHMGCFAAFNALKVACDALVARPSECVLVTCVEACSLHLRKESSQEQAVIHSLFGDACVTLALSAGRAEGSPRIVRSHTRTLYEAKSHMSWDVTNDGFRMTLSPYVPLLIAESIEQFVRELLEPVGLQVADVRHWGIHPGGPRIIGAVAERLRLGERQQRASKRVLEEFGNCSSATILLILKELVEHEDPRPGEWGMLMAFGPGLTMEGMLLQF